MHFVAGPWFAVFETGTGQSEQIAASDGAWADYGRVYLTHGQESGPGVLQLRIKFADEQWPDALDTGSTQ